MRFCPLASSSRGNAYLLEDGETKLLIECGVSFRKLQKMLKFGVANLSACLVSHEHTDHSRSCAQLLENGVPVFSSYGTAVALERGDITILEDRTPVGVGSMDVLPFPTFHDAAEPMGFLIRSRIDGDKLVFATDTVNLGYQFPGVTAAAIECNYAADILERSERVPDKVKHRILNAHMSLDRACFWLKTLDKTILREVFLLHLSDACSDQARFMREVGNAVGPGVRVTICPREVLY